MDRCALFVDAGYVLADGAMAVHGTRHRESVSWDYIGLLQFFGSIARERTSLPLLRCYWYEATVEGRRTSEHDTLADLPGLKLRLGRMRPGRREGMESEIRRDLTTLARNNAISDALLVSAEEDLAQVVADVQDLGIRVTIVHITVGGNWTISRSLRQECDDIIEIGEAHLRPYTDLVAGAEALSAGEPYQLAVSAGRALTNGHGPVVGPLGHQALSAASHPAPPAIYTAPVVAEYQRAAQPMPSAQQPSALPRREPAAPIERQALPDARGAAGSSGTPVLPGAHGAMQDPLGPATLPPQGGQGMPVPPQGGQGIPATPGTPGQQGLQGEQSAQRQQSMPGLPGGGQGQHGIPGQTAMPGQQGMAGQQGMPGLHAAPSMPPGPSSPGLPDPRIRGSHAQPPAEDQNVQAGSQPLYAAPTAGTFRGPAQDVPSGQGGAARQPMTGHAGSPGQSMPGQSMPGQAMPGQAMPGQAMPGQAMPGQAMPGQAMPGQAMPGQAMPGQAMPGQGLQGPPRAYQQGPYGVMPSEQMMPGQFPSAPAGQQEGAGSAYVPPQSPYGGQQAAPHTPAPPPGQALPLADAVQAAHAEGFEFGQSVAREAPALWLEAVLARKPRMPSDLEARLLQDSALPIDSLLHDETRHALRRGFWDALERSRR